jgi:hypothetical protein
MVFILIVSILFSQTKTETNMSEHGVFRGYNGMAPHMSMPKSMSGARKLQPMSALPGIINNAKPVGSAMPTVSKVVGMPQKNMSVERGMQLERVKPSATKQTPGMISLEMR